MATKKVTELNIEQALKDRKGSQAKLQLARVILQEKTLQKTGKNTYANFKYFQLADFLPEVNKIFYEVGLFSQFQIIPKVIFPSSDETNVIIKEMATLNIYDLNNSNDVITYAMEVQPVMIGNNTKQNLYQAAGGRSTYYKRYLYRDALEIEENDEIDAVSGSDDVNYTIPQTVQPVIPQSIAPQTVQPVIPQEEPVISNPSNPNQVSALNLAQQYENKYTEAISNVNPEDILSEECRMYVMDLISKKNGNAFEIINNYCVQNGIVSPDQLQNKHFDGLVDFINNQ